MSYTLVKVRCRACGALYQVTAGSELEAIYLERGARDGIVQPLGMDKCPACFERREASHTVLFNSCDGSRQGCALACDQACLAEIGLMQVGAPPPYTEQLLLIPDSPVTSPPSHCV